MTTRCGLAIITSTVVLCVLAVALFFVTESDSHHTADSRTPFQDHSAIVEASPEAEFASTFSIVAADPETGICGAAVASKYPGVGRVVPYVRAGVGAFCTQHYLVRDFGERALDLLEEGKRPEEVLGELLTSDDRPEQRQLAIVDVKGRAVNLHPTEADRPSLYWGGMTGRYYACQGNTLTGREVIEAMAKAYEETRGSLADRLMAALIAGDCVGGDHRGRLGTGIRVAKPGVKGVWLDLQVDESDDAVIELARRYNQLEHDAKGDWSGGKPPFQHPCAECAQPAPPSNKSKKTSQHLENENLRETNRLGNLEKPTGANLVNATFAKIGAVVNEEWPRWRGVRGGGTWYGPKLPGQWPEAGLLRVWSQPIGGGYAGVSVVNGRVFTMDYQKQPVESERVLCFDAASGKPVWTDRYPVTYGDLDYGNGPRSAPTVHDGAVYTLGAKGDLRCLDEATGRVIWSRQAQQELKAREPGWGFAGSPLIFQDRVIVPLGVAPDGGVVAFDRKTGKEVWRSLPDEAGYATPILIESSGRTQLVCWTPSQVTGLDPHTGKPFWSIPFEVTYGTSIATPIFAEQMVLVCNYWEGTKAIRLGPEISDANLEWENRQELRGLMSQPLYRDGYGYLLEKRDGLTCFEMKTGKKLWDDGNKLTPEGRNPQASLVRLGDSDRAIVLNSDGDLILIRLSPDGYEEISRTHIIDPPESDPRARARGMGAIWAHPAYAGPFIYARSDRELICVSLTTPSRSE